MQRIGQAICYDIPIFKWGFGSRIWVEGNRKKKHCLLFYMMFARIIEEGERILKNDKKIIKSSLRLWTCLERRGSSLKKIPYEICHAPLPKRHKLGHVTRVGDVFSIKNTLSLNVLNQNIKFTTYSSIQKQVQLCLESLLIISITRIKPKILKVLKNWTADGLLEICNALKVLVLQCPQIWIWA